MCWPSRSRTVLLVAVLQHLDQQLLLGAEVVQHARVRDADLLGHLGERAVLVPLEPKVLAAARRISARRSVVAWRGCRARRFGAAAGGNGVVHD